MGGRPHARRRPGAAPDRHLRARLGARPGSGRGDQRGGGARAGVLDQGLRPVRQRPSLAHRGRAEGLSDVVVVASSTAPVEAPVEVPVEEIGEPEALDVTLSDRPWIVIVWNDPVNLIVYVCYVLQKLFGYGKSKAMRLTMQVHNEGKAVVSSGTREKAEADVARLHAHGLWATMEHPS